MGLVPEPCGGRYILSKTPPEKIRMCCASVWRRSTAIPQLFATTALAAKLYVRSRVAGLSVLGAFLWWSGCRSPVTRKYAPVCVSMQRSKPATAGSAPASRQRSTADWPEGSQKTCQPASHQPGNCNLPGRRRSRPACWPVESPRTPAEPQSEPQSAQPFVSARSHPAGRAAIVARPSSVSSPADGICNTLTIIAIV